MQLLCNLQRKKEIRTQITNLLESEAPVLKAGCPAMSPHAYKINGI